MNPDKWLKRKYPESYEKVRELLDDQALLEFKKNKRKIGILKEDIIDCQKYFKGIMFIYHHQKDFTEDGWTGGFNYYCIFKCQKGFAQSGYHSFLKWGLNFTKIEK